MPRGLVALAVLSLAAIALSVAAIVMTVTRPASTSDQCRTLAWDALPDPASLPDGWSVTATNFYVGGVGTSLVGPAPSDGTSASPTVYLQITCYGDDSHLAMVRSHDSAIAAGNTDVTFTALGDESFATTDAASSGTAVYVRQGPLVAMLAAQSGVDQGDLGQAAQAVADGLSGAGAATANGGPSSGTSPAPSVAAIEPTSSEDAGASPSDVPSHVAPDLEAMLPKTIAGTTMASQSTSGTTALGDDQSSQSLVASLQKLGKKPSDLQIAEAYDPDQNVDAEVIAFGRPASRRLRSARPSSTAGWPAGPRVSRRRRRRSRASRSPGRLRRRGSFDYLYEKGDVVFDVSTSDPAVAAETLTQLP
jgi:hypothetical protein